MKVKKFIYLTLGLISTVLAFVGAVLPVLPATPFIAMAAYCYARSSERLNNWLRGTKLYKNNIEGIVKGKGLTKRAKLRIMLSVTLIMVIGFFSMGRLPVAQFILVIVWIGHILYFWLGVKNLPSENEV